ncbi:MAG: hypothetical protein NTV55_11305 [Planctomycetota bacterium]|nr:hypothetical protein [Planctomycetota bacterium]
MRETNRKSRTLWRATLGAGTLVLVGLYPQAGSLFAAGPDQTQPKPADATGLSFGQLRSMDPLQARARTEELLAAAGSQVAKAQADAIWNNTQQPLADRVTDTLALGIPEVAALMARARGIGSLPEGLPAWLKDDKQPAFARGAVALAAARALSLRGVHDETLEMLKLVRPEVSIDPGTQLFLKAVAEHGLVKGLDAQATLDRMLADVADLSERHRAVGTLMVAEISRWKDKDLGWISRKMGQIHHRLEIERGGRKTRDMQKEVVVRLDEMIKEMENQQKQASASNEGNCPDGGPQDGQGNGGGAQPSTPMEESKPAGGSGQGDVDTKKAKEIADVWGKLPDRERAQAMRDLASRAPAKYRETLEIYFKRLNDAAPGGDRRKSP